MKNLASCGVLPAIAMLIGSANFAASQEAGAGMAMAAKTLLVAQLDAAQVTGGSSSSATATGAFLLDPVQHTLTYNLTYQGLESGGATSIALYNFGAGKNGEVIRILCGVDAPPCPAGGSATISGRFERGDKRPLDNQLISEFDSERVYIEIVGGNGKPEIRGQLAPNSAMVMVAEYVASLGPAAGTGSKGSGTAVLSEVHLPGGKISVFYATTVAGTSGEPMNAALVNAPTPKTLTFTARAALPKLERRLSRDPTSGGSFTGSYEVNSSTPDALFATRMLQTSKGNPAIVVTTNRFPKGELYGALVPVR